MTSIEVKSEFCPKNHPCPVMYSCPVGAISQKDIFSAPVIDEEKCKNCGLCCNFCRVFTCSK